MKFVFLKDQSVNPVKPLEYLSKTSQILKQCFEEFKNASLYLFSYFLATSVESLTKQVFAYYSTCLSLLLLLLWYCLLIITTVQDHLKMCSITFATCKSKHIQVWHLGVKLIIILCTLMLNSIIEGLSNFYNKLYRQTWKFVLVV